MDAIADLEKPSSANQARELAKVPARVASIDVFRGFVMFLLVAEALAPEGVSRNLPGSRFWSFLAYEGDHVAWAGCSLHDLIQPGFSFLVGVALVFSLVARQARGQSSAQMRLHACWRAFLLMALGIFLRSVGRSQTYYTFEDTLTQIGLGYIFLFFLGESSAKVQWAALAAILVGYWAAFALYPLPGANFDWANAGVTAAWDQNFQGFAAHWNKNTNLAWAFDTWFLNLFPCAQRFSNNSGGYCTLSFIPTLGTMVLGLIAGGWLRNQETEARKVLRFVIVGAAGMALAVLLHVSGICPIVKRIWTPSWVLFSGGYCFLFLAAFHWLTEVKGWRAWVFPLILFGANSIATYCLTEQAGGYIRSALKTNLPTGYANILGTPYAPLVQGVCVILVYWLILFWMYRRRIFLRI
jgi:predicted acyltransferase